MVSMNTGRIKELTHFTDDQIDYLMKKVDVLKREKEQGKAREYSFRDLVFLGLASEMRADGIRLDTINKAITLIDQNWKITENPYVAGRLMIYDDQPLWSLATDIWFMGDGYSQPLDSMRRIGGHYYNVTRIAGELSLDQMELNLKFEAIEVQN